jgi:TetR/AcrR family transcriptional regulator, transcriptional repressor for nem operon
MIGLPSDVARESPAVKGAFREILTMMTEIFAANLAGEAAERRERALMLSAACVGGMVLARAVDDGALADELRASVRRQVLAAAGWPA